MSDEERQRFIEVEWDTEKQSRSFETDISLLAEDRKGLFRRYLKDLRGYGRPYHGVMGKSNSDNTAVYDHRSDFKCQSDRTADPQTEIHGGDDRNSQRKPIS